MTYGRIEHHPVLGTLPLLQEVRILFDGQPFECREGESIAAALLANGIRQLRVHEEQGTPRGIYCNIGHCMECRVTINEVAGFRACITPATEGMDIRSGRLLPSPFHSVRVRSSEGGGSD